MGIKQLNRFLLSNCKKKTIYKTHLKHFSNKTFVIDTSIYLYKFMGENTLLESMYLFISILKHYNIIPIFIFDGKPPPEKKELLAQRITDKKDAQKKYMEIKKMMENTTLELTEEKKEEMVFEMEQLKKQFVRIKNEDIKKVKDLMDAYGVIYYDAPNEADMLCSHFVKSGKAWACMSDDMDMFVYGCNRVIRHMSLLNHTVIFYDTDVILKDLEMDEKIFREIMVLSGTDYNMNTETNLYETINWFYEYNKYLNMNTDMNIKLDFYGWLVKYTKYVSNYELLVKTHEMFVLNENKFTGTYDMSIIKPTNIPKLQNLLSDVGFIFII